MTDIETVRVGIWGADQALSRIERVVEAAKRYHDLIAEHENKTDWEPPFPPALHALREALGALDG